MRVSLLVAAVLTCAITASAQELQQQHLLQREGDPAASTLLVSGVDASQSSTREPFAASSDNGDTPEPPKSSPPRQSYEQALSLLSALTRAAPPPPPSSYTSSHRSSPNPALVLLDNYGGPVSRLSHRIRDAVASFLQEKEQPVSASSMRKRMERWKSGVVDRTAGVKVTKEELKVGLEEVVRLAGKAAEDGVPEASLLLGDLLLSGHLTLEADPARALQAFTNASEMGGLPEAQYKLGFLYGSNYGKAIGATEGVGSQGSALLHYTFAALSGHVPASMTVGYRHWVGIGTKQSCKGALPYYKAAADAAMRAFNAGPPGGRLLPPPKIRLSDLTGGPYGPGASASSRPHITGGSTSQTQQEWDDLVEFHLFHASRGDPTYMFRLGRLHYQGFGAAGAGGARGGKGRLNPGVPGLKDGLWEGGRDFRNALKWFTMVARGVWKLDGKPIPPGGAYDAAKDPKQNVDDHYAMVAGLAAGYLGRMYMRGEGVRVDYSKAFLWFSRGSSQNDRESTNGLGVLYRDGLGVSRDLKRANAYFLAAAQQDLAEAQVNIGKYHFGIGEWAAATTYFEHAIRYDGIRTSDTFQAYYYLAELQARSVNRADQCPHAVSFYKVVAERGDWDHEVWWEAERALARGDERTALLGYWIMAERGYEAAQNNLAWILDRDKRRIRVPVVDDEPAAANDTDRLALAYWTRSAAQDNVDALVKMGDYYFDGRGVEAGSGPQLERAAACYQSAVTSRISAMAMWNLGWMHENGKGVVKDYHLAKRYYDMALETSADAYLPATLSLISLYARSFYNSVFGTDEELKSLSLFARPPFDENDPASASSGTSENDPSPTAHQPWSFGRVWREAKRRWGFEEGGDLGGDFEVSSHTEGAHYEQRDVAEAQRALEGHDDQMHMEWAMRGRGEGDDDDLDDYFMGEGEGDFAGTLAIVILCGVLAWLVYFRQARVPQPAAQANAPAPVAAPAAGGVPAPTPAAGPVPPPAPPLQEDEVDNGDIDDEN